ncbi:chemotaxis protein [Sporohalobacter salinus]|uniref:chemotaxis protein n=1 Tax=Sporohalobacter salinus TaxID=1494606 RepID=UPI0019619713|nr:chemotaxis protein [Sporohalobacter salinus]MBM7624663.1 two-component system chemotaxis response regulator CheV [Sporohalobacter salinus]
MSKDETDILLESGTGELEVLKFKVKGVLYAINVIKVREVLRVENEKIRPLSSKADSVKGMVNIRGDVVTVIDLNDYLDCGIYQESDKDSYRMILTEFNDMKILFIVGEVIGIDRLLWEDIEEPNELMGGLINGVIKLDGELASFLDFEKILTDIKPELSMTIDENKIDEVNRSKRENITLVMAEDSPTIRGVLEDTLRKAGYQDLKIFNDGKRLLDYLLEIKDENPDESILNYVQGVITDIEMPQLDGHTLIRKINEDRYLEELPTMIFSSLITESLRHKGEAVGADRQISKPEINNLISILDELVLD